MLPSTTSYVSACAITVSLTLAVAGMLSAGDGVYAWNRDGGNGSWVGGDWEARRGRDKHHENGRLAEVGIRIRRELKAVLLMK